VTLVLSDPGWGCQGWGVDDVANLAGKVVGRGLAEANSEDGLVGAAPQPDQPHDARNGLETPSKPSSTARNVTVTVTTNQCPKGGSVARIWYSIDKGGEVNAAGGDTASTWSQLGVLTHVTGTAFCKTAWWGGGYYNNFYQVPRYFWSNGYHTYI
jgi:hypothetical protein